MLSERASNRDLMSRCDRERVRYSPHFDLPILRRQPRPAWLMILCVRCFFVALGVATAATIALMLLRR